MTAGVISNAATTKLTTLMKPLFMGRKKLPPYWSNLLSGLDYLTQMRCSTHAVIARNGWEKDLG